MIRECINTYEQLQAAGGGVAIVARQSGPISGAFAGWAILRVNAAGKQVVTDDDAAWYDHGMKSFHARWQDRMAILEVAKTWVGNQGWGNGPWKRNRMGAYVEAAVNEAYPLRKVAP